jgi:hypothetical protein
VNEPFCDSYGKCVFDLEIDIFSKDMEKVKITPEQYRCLRKTIGKKIKE